MQNLTKPILSYLNNNQLAAYSYYEANFKDFENNNLPTKEQKNNMLKYLNDFYHSLDSMMQKSLKNWYTIQLCEIDPLLVPCAKMSGYLNETNLKDSFAISQDGLSFLLLFDVKDRMEQAIDMLGKNFPNMKYQILELAI